MGAGIGGATGQCGHGKGRMKTHKLTEGELRKLYPIGYKLLAKHCTVAERRRWENEPAPVQLYRQAGFSAEDGLRSVLGEQGVHENEMRLDKLSVANEMRLDRPSAARSTLGLVEIDVDEFPDHELGEPVDEELEPYHMDECCLGP